MRGVLVVWMFCFLRVALRRGDARGVLLGAAKHRGGVREERVRQRAAHQVRAGSTRRVVTDSVAKAREAFRRESSFLPDPSDDAAAIAFVLLVVRASIDGGKRREFTRGVGDGVERLQFLPGVAPPGRERLLRQRGARYPGRGRRQRRQRASSRRRERFQIRRGRVRVHERGHERGRRADQFFGRGANQSLGGVHGALGGVGAIDGGFRRGGFVSAARLPKRLDARR